MVAAVSQDTGLTLSHPDRVTYRGKTAAVGPRGFALLKLLLPGRSAGVGAVCRELWGEDEAAVPAVRVRNQCVYTGRILKRLGYPGRLGVDRGNVVLYA
jgi:hypothetical protein